MNTNKISEKISKTQKPTEYDIHLKYICKQCGQIHWLSIKEASTTKFKIVCFCGLVFGVKRVKDFKLTYHKKLKQVTKIVELENSTQKIIPSISDDLLDQSIKVLIGYGFTKTEAKILITKSYEDSPTDNTVVLVKQTLESLRSTDVK